MNIIIYEGLHGAGKTYQLNKDFANCKALNKFKYKGCDKFFLKKWKYRINRENLTYWVRNSVKNEVFAWANMVENSKKALNPDKTWHFFDRSLASTYVLLRMFLRKLDISPDPYVHEIYSKCIVTLFTILNGVKSGKIYIFKNVLKNPDSRVERGEYTNTELLEAYNDFYDVARKTGNERFIKFV